jgi:DNA polymerase-3 subunit beta
LINFRLIRKNSLTYHYHQEYINACTAPKRRPARPAAIGGRHRREAHTLPILSNVLIETEGDALTLLATDIEIQIRTPGPTSGRGCVAITVGARKLQDILRALPDTAGRQPHLDDKRSRSSSGKSRFSCRPCRPGLPPLAGRRGRNVSRFSLTQRKPQAQLALVQYAMAQQDIRYYLNGLLLVVAARLRAGRHRRPPPGLRQPKRWSATDRTDVILPRKTVLELARQLADNDDPVDIAPGGNQARLPLRRRSS